MKIKYLNKMFAISIYSMLTIGSATATEQPNAEDLVGKIFGGLHALHIQTDDDRLITSDPLSAMDYGNGFGGEIGYRWLPSTEFRFTHSQFKLTSENDGYPEPDGTSNALDILYFPTEKNFYLLTGVNNLDIGSSQISANLGAGYRYYLSERAAIYIEGKANYQFSERYDEFTSQIGFVYFFGDNADKNIGYKNNKPSKIAAIDSDKDGIFDHQDQCAKTPIVEKVNAIGCTIFADRFIKKQLLVKFDHNKAIIKPQYITEIANIADFLNENKSLSLTIEGHTSSLGTDLYNKTLSQQRAQAIVNFLIKEHNIDNARLSTVGYGEEQLKNSANTNAAHAENRRIEAKLEITHKVAVKR